MTDSDTGRIKKTDQAQKIRTEICRIFFNRQMAFNPLHLNHLQQVRCYCWCKVKNSESKSQRKNPFGNQLGGCYCWCKVKNSESKSQQALLLALCPLVVIAGVKLKILKANHNKGVFRSFMFKVVIAGVKLKILKANHNTEASGLAQSRNHGCLYHEAPGLGRCSQLPFHRI